MSPKIERPLPPYLQILQAIRAQITDGTLKEGTSVPSERQISTDWDVSRATATKVLAALRSEGLVQSVQGVGTVVSAQTSAASSAQGRFTTMRRTGRIYGPGEYAKIESARVVPASAHVADALGLPEGADVIERRRVTYKDDAPVSASCSWFDAALAAEAPKLLEAERIREGTPGYIQAVSGRRYATGRDQVTAKAATVEDAALLGITEGAPIRAGRNWLYDSEGAVIEYGESIAHPGRWASYDYTLNAD